jgi:hypothetical protein
MDTPAVEERSLSRRAWLRLQFRSIESQRYQAAAILLASPVLWLKLGRYIPVRAPWGLEGLGRGSLAWSSSERCLWSLAVSLIEAGPTSSSFVSGLSNLDRENATHVVTAVAVASGTLDMQQALDRLGLV